MSEAGSSIAASDAKENSDYGYDVFLSYRRSDGSSFARRFRRKLLSAHRRLPIKANPLRVYLDRIQARADLDFYAETVLPALTTSSWFIVIATPDAASRPVGQSDWIAQEIDDFIRLRGIDRIRVVHATGDAMPNLPQDLISKMASAQKIDMRGLFGLLPAARAQEDWESLLATLFDLGAQQMSALRREEERLTRNRFARFAGAAAGAAIFATGLSGYAIYQTAESRNNVDRAASILGTYLDPSQFGVCDGLEALWGSGATRKTIPMVECLIARSDNLWYDDKQDEARAKLGSWKEFETTLPARTADMGEELAHARHLFEMAKIEYDHNEATDQWIINEGVLPPQGRATALRAIDEVDRALGQTSSLEVARKTLSIILWPLLQLIEKSSDMQTSRALMERAAGMLEPNAKLNLESGAASDDDWLLDYGLLARRIAYFANKAGDQEVARRWSDISVEVFGGFEQTEAWTLYQHGLARMVRGDVLEGEGLNASEEFNLAHFQMTKSIEHADPSWERLQEVKQSLAYIDLKLAQ